MRLWEVDALDQAPLELYSGAPEIFTLAFAPDDKSIAMAGPDGMVYVLDTASGDELHSWQAHDQAVYALDISPDGTHLATASQDKTAVIWDISGQDPQKLQTLFDHTNSVTDVRFSPNGACLATTSLDRTAKVWDAQTGQLLLNLPGLGDWGTAVAFDPPVCRRQSRQPQSMPGGPSDRCGQWLATASRDGVARLWAIGPNHEDTVFVGHKGPVETAVFSPNGRQVATGSDDGTVRIWDAASGSQEEILAGRSGEPLGRVNRVAYSPDGKLLAAASYDGATRLYDSQSGELRATLEEPRSKTVQSVAFSPDGTLVATAGDNTRGKGTAVLWDVASGQPRSSWSYDGPMYGVAFSPAGDRLAVTGSDGQVDIYDTASGDLQTSFSTATSRSTTAAFSPDGKLLATASWDNTAHCGPYPQANWCTRLPATAIGCTASQFSPDGRNTGDLQRRSHRAAVGRRYRRGCRTLRGPEFNGLQFSPDGRKLVAGGEDGTARMFALDLTGTGGGCHPPSDPYLDAGRMLAVSAHRSMPHPACRLKQFVPIRHKESVMSSARKRRALCNLLLVLLAAHSACRLRSRSTAANPAAAVTLLSTTAAPRQQYTADDSVCHSGVRLL